MILGLGMGVAGAALATIISQGLSALWVVRFLLGKKTGLRIRRENLGLDWKLYGPCLALGLSLIHISCTCPDGRLRFRP